MNLRWTPVDLRSTRPNQCTHRLVRVGQVPISRSLPNVHHLVVLIGLLLPLGGAFAQPAKSLADLRWSAAETKEGRFVVVPGERAFIGGYSRPGLEVWTYPLQLVHGYWVSFRVEGDSSEIDGRSSLRSVEHTPIAATRVYAGPDFTVREQIFVPIDRSAAAISHDR